MLFVLLLSSAVFASTNENIRFIENIREEARHYTSGELNKWRFGDGVAVVPESADIKKREDVRLLVAANPDRYEGYVMYGLHFFLKHDFETAVAAYGKAVEIIKTNKISETVAFADYYDLSLAKLYYQEHDLDNAKALRAFERLVDYDFNYFERDEKMANFIGLAALDYYSLGDYVATRKLIQRARTLKHLPSDVTSLLDQINERIEKTREPTNTTHSATTVDVKLNH